MAIQVINVGSSANSGGGDPLRSAMIKINENFTELYRRTGGEQAQTIIGADSTVLVDGPNSSLNANALSGTVPTDLISFSDLANPPDTIAGFGITDAYTKIQVYTKPEVDTLLEGPRDIKGTVVGDDSTVLIDGVNSTINAAALTGALPAIDGSALTGITATANNLVGDMKGSVYADDSTLLVDGVNGTLNSSALTKPIALADDEKTIFGAGDDLQIWHNGANSIIQNSTGELQLRGNTIRLLNAATTKDFAFFNNNGSVDLYYDGTKKFETTSDGISVTDHIALADDGELRLGSDNDMQVYHSGTAGFVKNTTGTLILQGPTVRIQDAGSSQTAFSASNGVATLLFENATKLETNTNGVTITGDTTVSGNLTAGTGTVGGLTFAGTQIASDDSTQISFQDNIEIAGGPVISGFNLSHTGTFTINPYGLNLNTTGGNIAINPNNNLTLDVTGSSKTISIGNASTSGSAVSIGAEVNNTSVRMNGVTEFNARAIFSRGTHEIFYTFNGQGGVTDHNVMLGHLFYHTGVTSDLTPNFTNFDLTAEDATNITIIINQGNTAYEIPAIQIGGAAQTIVWQNNNAPTGTANGTDSFSFTILNDGGTYVVLGQMVSFGGV